MGPVAARDVDDETGWITFQQVRIGEAVVLVQKRDGSTRSVIARGRLPRTPW